MTNHMHTICVNFFVNNETGFMKLSILLLYKLKDQWFEAIPVQFEPRLLSGKIGEKVKIVLHQVVF